jgi:hypothetical protein
VLVAQVLEMAFKDLRLFLVLSAQLAVVLGAVTTALAVMVVLVVALQMALLEERQHLGKVIMAALAHQQEAV